MGLKSYLTGQPTNLHDQPEESLTVLSGTALCEAQP